MAKRGKMINIIILTFGMMFAYLLYVTTFRSYTEFSPQMIGFRHVDVITIPFTGVPATAPRFGDFRRTATMQWIIDEEYVDIPEPVDWCATRRSDPYIMTANCQYIITSLSRDDWINWSRKYPDRAKQLWPLFAKLSRHRIRFIGLEEAAALLREMEQFREKETTFDIVIDKYNDKVDALSARIYQ